MFFFNDFVMIVFMIFLMICLGENINVYEFLCFFLFLKWCFMMVLCFFLWFLSLSLHRDLFYVFLNDVLCVFIIFNDGLRCFMFFMFLCVFMLFYGFFCFLKCFFNDLFNDFLCYLMICAFFLRWFNDFLCLKDFFEKHLKKNIKKKT